MQMRHIPIMWTGQATTGTNEHTTNAEGNAEWSDTLDMREIGQWTITGEITGATSHDAVATTLDYRYVDADGNAMDEELNCTLQSESLTTADSSVRRFTVAPRIANASLNTIAFQDAITYMQVSIQSGDADKAVTVKMWLEGLVQT